MTYIRHSNSIHTSYMSPDIQHSGRENIFLACNTAGNTAKWRYSVVVLPSVLVPIAVAGIRSFGCRTEEDGGDAAVGDGGREAMKATGMAVA
jgi:hypothetical protein